MNKLRSLIGVKLVRVLFFLYLYIGFNDLNAQAISSRVLDSITGKPVYSATILAANEYGVSANENGYFEIPVNREYTKKDSIWISSIGYEELRLPMTKKIDTVIYLKPKVEDLGAVFVSNKKLSLEEILESVKDNLDKNYIQDLTKKTLFFRQSDNNYTNKILIDFKKSTLKEIDEDFIKNEVSKIPKKSIFHTEILADFYGDSKNGKLDIEKANKLYDIYGEDYLTSFYKKIETILNNNIKKDSYFKIKSGFFSFKTDTDLSFIDGGELLDMRNDMGKNEEANMNFFLNLSRKTIGKIFENLIYNKDSKLNFILKPNHYDFELLDLVEIGSDLAYKIKFDPDGNEDFKGVFYVNMDDFAVLRVDYQNIKPLRSIKLLGFSYKEKGYKGTMLYKKGVNDKYVIKYIENIQTKKYGIDRPVKIIEKNKNTKGRRKQNEISADVEFQSTVVTDYRILINETKLVSKTEFDQIIENTKEQPKNWKKFSTNFWKDYSEASTFDDSVIQLKSNLK